MGVIVRQKTKGKGKPWWVFVSHDGQRTSKKVGTKEAAQEVAKLLEARIALGEDVFEEEEKEYSEEKESIHKKIYYFVLIPIGFTIIRLLETGARFDCWPFP